MLLDFVFIFIVIISILLGYRKGFSQMLLSCAIFLFSIVIATSIYNNLGDYFLKSEYGSELHASVSSSIGEHLADMENSAIENVPYLALIGISSDNNEQLIDIREISDKLSLKAIKAALVVPLLILTYILLRMLIFVIRIILKKATELPVIHGIDSLLGSVCGLIMGIISMILIYMLISYIQFVPAFKFINEQFSSSLIVLTINDFIF